MKAALLILTSCVLAAQASPKKFVDTGLKCLGSYLPKTRPGEIEVDADHLEKIISTPRNDCNLTECSKRSYEALKYCSSTNNALLRYSDVYLGSCVRYSVDVFNECSKLNEGSIQRAEIFNETTSKFAGAYTKCTKANEACDLALLRCVAKEVKPDGSEDCREKAVNAGHELGWDEFFRAFMTGSQVQQCG